MFEVFEAGQKEKKRGMWGDKFRAKKDTVAKSFGSVIGQR